MAVTGGWRLGVGPPLERGAQPPLVIAHKRTPTPCRASLLWWPSAWRAAWRVARRRRPRGLRVNGAWVDREGVHA